MTTRYVEQRGSFGYSISDKLFMGQSLGAYLRSLVTPFNAVAAIILAIGIPVAVMRFTQGLGATTNLTNTNPWGIWIGFDVLSGVALAAGGYVISSAVYILGLKEYKPIVRPAILTGFLGYFFVVVGLLFDLGRPYRLPFPMFVSFGVTSVMLEVAWCVFFYLGCLALEFCPAPFEWLGWKRLRRWVVKLTIALTVVGVMLSTLHQSSLGALFLITPGKLHPLWYSPLIPLYFFVSSVFAGLSVVIMESMLSHRAFVGQLGSDQKTKLDNLTIGLGKAAALVLFPYFWLKVINIMHGNNWEMLNTPLGNWFLVELLGFILLPCFLFLWGAQDRNINIIRFAAIITVIGVVINRLNVSIIAFNWTAAERYVPRWTEVIITLMIITIGVLTFRWIVNRMPILHEHPEYRAEH